MLLGQFDYNALLKAEQVNSPKGVRDSLNLILVLHG